MLTTLLLCTVIGISDGDTLTARCATEAGARTLAIRLAEIDSPERRQPYGWRSRQQLAALCLREAAHVRPASVDRYGRTVAHVTCRGADASAQQVRAGMAWVFDQYATQASLYRLEAEARQARRGLWSQADPVAPWEWRRREEARRVSAASP
jgi:endonuclease YncB( thermonuclease family)